MAKQEQDSNNIPLRTFDTKLNEDINDFHLPSNEWTQARNAINNSKSGDLGKLGNEAANLFCTKAPYTIVGTIHLQEDMWAIFSTNNIDSEIGIFTEGLCNYELLVNDRCLNFSTKNLIIGTSKFQSDCTVNAYWDDGLNPSRFISINTNLPHNKHVPYVCVDVLPGPCIDCQPILPLKLDCDKIRLAPLSTPPCLRVEKGVNGGTLLNGSYFVVAAYTINQLKVTDYYTPSNVQSLFSHDNVSGSLDIFVDFADTRFDEYELVLVSTINQQTVARRVGIYSTHQGKITLDIINNTWTSVPIEQISILNPIVEKADAMFSVADYLLRVGPYNKLDFNYQPFANQIVTKWQAVRYPVEYYRKGGHNTGYLRDEVYALFIRWVYDTGDKSSDYHIPGRAPMPFNGLPGSPLDTAPYFGAEALAGDSKVFESFNTANGLAFPGTLLPDGGIVDVEGFMGYWESTELYPDDKPQIWNSATNTFLNFGPGQNYNITLGPYPGTNLFDYDLCAKPIRHHRMPDNAIHPLAYHFGPAGASISILGLAFSNIKPPLDNSGNLIPGIIGYEILRGSRQGNRSIIAKGVVNNMANYSLGNISPRTGAYANYPYNDVNPDPFLSTTITSTGVCNIFGNNFPGLSGVSPQNNFSNNLFSFHSPDTNFTHPFLSTKELKSYGMYQGNVLGKFEFSEKHPREKLVTNVAFLTSLIAGFGIAYMAMMGKPTFNFKASQPGGHGFTTVLGTGYGPGVLGAAGAAISTAGSLAGIIGAGSLPTVLLDIAAMISGIGITPLGGPADTIRSTSNMLAGLVTGVAGGGDAGGMQDTSKEAGLWSVTPAPLRGSGIAAPTFLYYLSEGTDSTLRLIKNILRYRDFGLKYNSHCFYNFFAPPIANQNRREIGFSNYIGPNIQDFGSNYRINNEYRSDYVAIELLNAMTPIINADNSRQQTQVGTVGTVAYNANVNNSVSPAVVDEPTKNAFTTNSTCAYVGLKQRIRNQYGQLHSILQMPVTTCIQYTLPGTIPVPNQALFVGNSSVMFNGDIYIGRYTEKNTFFYFYEWLYDQPDGYEFDYLKHRMLLYPTYWGNFENFETQDFTGKIANALPAGLLTPVATIGNALPSSFYVLDGYTCPGPFQFAVKNAWFYLFNSGVRDFFVESEINIDQRDWGDTDSEKHFDVHGGAISDVKTLFDTSIIKSRNFYKYDQSLSVSKTYINYISWGSLQLTSYDPYLAETCFQHDPTRLIYSLPANFESKKDLWRIFLPLNFTSFTSRVTCIKSINKSGAIIFFESASPVQFQGTDTIETGLSTKLVIGDGKLFDQPLQSMTNADTPYEYASCQNRLSVISTPAGAYWISQNQGKIFTTAKGGLKEVSNEMLKWWFAQYLPYRLTLDFPNFDLTDNPVSGIGCQSIYDNLNGLLYFCKKDYVLRKDITAVVTYNVGQQQFYVNGVLKIAVGDPKYFHDASWTISYDPKIDGFIGYHDWHPDLLLPSKNTFMSISKTAVDPNQTNGIWIHNERCDLYCNYYGKDYPFEVEFAVNTGPNINTLRSIEYIMEMYKYAPNCYDRYHILNENFDEATIYNTEQCSGLLKLDLTPRNNLPLLLQYPIINATNIQILYSKVESRYRFNQFWDITREQGSQDVGIPGVPAFAQQTIWNTPDNGYAKVLNTNNMNYTKAEVERKKFRGYNTSVLLRRLISGSRKMLVMLADTKDLNSPR